MEEAKGHLEVLKRGILSQVVHHREVQEEHIIKVEVVKLAVATVQHNLEAMPHLQVLAKGLEVVIIPVEIPTMLKGILILPLLEGEDPTQLEQVEHNNMGLHTLKAYLSLQGLIMASRTCQIKLVSMLTWIVVCTLVPQLHTAIKCLLVHLLIDRTTGSSNANIMAAMLPVKNFQ